MKFSFGIALATSILASIVYASPQQLTKRASTSEPATVGFATLGGGTTGGIGATYTTPVSTLTDLQNAATGDALKIIIISGPINGNVVVDIGSNTSILGKNSAAALVGIGLRIKDKNNVIIRNLRIQKVLADAGDAIGIQASRNIWIDHVDLSSDMDHDKDYYDGLIDITHGVDYVTISHCFLHDHFKGTLVGHSDSNSAEDTGHLTVTYKHNYFKNINTRTPTLRFGTGHIYNNYFLSVGVAITTRQGGKLLVQNNVFESTTMALSSIDGLVTYTGNDFGGATVDAVQAVPPITVPYGYSLGSTTNTEAYVIANAGNILTFP